MDVARIVQGATNRREQPCRVAFDLKAAAGVMWSHVGYAALNTRELVAQLLSTGVDKACLRFGFCVSAG